MVKTDVHKLIYIVDDNPCICKEICELLSNLGYRVSYFADALSCLQQLYYQPCDLLITDYRMPEMDGLELMNEAKHLFPWLPVLIITGYGDVPTAVKAIKAGAFNFLEKPLDKDTLIKVIKSVLWEKHKIERLNHSLTKMEKKVLMLILDGNNNEKCARLLNRSKRTIEVHRANIMKKFRVNNIVDLIKKSSLLNMNDISEESKPSDNK